ncbi:MAG: hypothetical protein QOG03_1218 [Actinomycetota bacterium]|jgi:GT2 family glycosyltransferase|nr:hypothetical protein [Actinomycetota bacterium]
MASSSAEPAATVVIATHGRAALLAETLDALAAQTRRDFEVVVVDDDSPDDTQALLATRLVRSLRVTRRGPGRARQAGWMAAAAPVIAFTDDDCVPTPGWLAAILEPIEAGRADFVQGPTMPRPDQLHLDGPWARTIRVPTENHRFPTCNMAYRKAVLDDLGGFRDEFTGPNTSGEDTDLGWRAKEAGYRIEFAPDALVHHAVWPSSFVRFVKDRPRWGMVVQVVRYHPGVREMAYKRYFFRRSHPRTIVLLCGFFAAAAIRRWLPPAMAVGVLAAYLVKTRDSERAAPERALHIAQVFTADVVELAVFVGASARYRTLFL